VKRDPFREAESSIRCAWNEPFVASPTTLQVTLACKHTRKGADGSAVSALLIRIQCCDGLLALLGGFLVFLLALLFHE